MPYILHRYTHHTKQIIIKAYNLVMKVEKWVVLEVIYYKMLLPPTLAKYYYRVVIPLECTDGELLVKLRILCPAKLPPSRLHAGYIIVDSGTQKH